MGPFASHSASRTVLAAFSLGLTISTAVGLEYPIGNPVNVNGMEVAAVYLQPIEMKPDGMMNPAATSDIHLEADIHALADNPNGFAEGEWMPHLKIQYRLVKKDSGEIVEGDFMKMVASDGPHYGDNVDLPGMGEYSLTFTIGVDPMFGRHSDPETGVAPWAEPFETRYEFVFAGTGKKGSY